MSDRKPNKKKQARILKILRRNRPRWTPRDAMRDEAGPKGFSNALGAYTKPPLHPESLEALRYVERRLDGRLSLYRITDGGIKALARYERDHADHNRADSSVLPHTRSTPHVSERAERPQIREEEPVLAHRLSFIPHIRIPALQVTPHSAFRTPHLSWQSNSGSRFNAP